MKLFYSPGAGSLAPHIALYESELPFEAVLAPTRTKMLPDGRSLAEINPKGYIPVLELDNGQHLTETLAILCYIADEAPHTQMAPPQGTFDRYRLLEWLSFVATELHKSFSPLFDRQAHESAQAAARERLHRRLTYLDDYLLRRNHLVDDHFTVADAYLWVVLSWGKYVNLDVHAFKNVSAYIQLHAARPSVVHALKAEGLLKSA